MATKLKNSPLVEVLFEIKFKDPSIVDYDLFVGEMYSKLKHKYPFNELLKPQEIPALLLQFNVQRRFRRVDKGYPLFQLGPGIASFNFDGATYNLPADECWAEFKKQLLEFLKVYKEVASDKFTNENIDHFLLRFINKIQDTKMYPGVKAYFSDELNLQIEPKFGNKLSFIDKLDHIQISQLYNLDPAKKTQLLANIITITEDARKLIVDLSVKSTELPAFEGIEK